MAGAELLVERQVREFDKSPINRRTGRSKSMPLMFPGQRCTVHLGGASIISTQPVFHVIAIDNRPFITVDQRNPSVLLNVNILDREGNLRLSIVENELAFVTDALDITFIKNRLATNGDDVFSMVFEPAKERIILESASFYYNGADLLVRGKGVHCQGANSGIVNGTCRLSGGPGVCIHVAAADAPLYLGYTLFRLPFPPERRYWWKR